MAEEKFEPSERLNAELSQLSPQQATGVIEIVKAELLGGSREWLVSNENPNKICSRSTLYARNRGGWWFKPNFQAALKLAREEYRAFRLGSVVDDAIDDLKLATTLATQDLRRQLVGDVDAVEMLAALLLDPLVGKKHKVRAAEALGNIGTPAATRALLDVFDQVDAGVRADIRGTIITALASSARGADPARRLAAMAVLDRASKLTASKVSEEGIDAEIRELMGELAATSEASAEAKPADGTLSPVPG